MSKEDPREEFETYNESRRGEPIDPQAAEEARRELLLDVLHDRTGNDDDRSGREAIIASMPEGALFKVDLADEKVTLAIEALSSARDVLIEDLNAASDSELLGDPRHTTFAALEEALEKESGTAKFPEGLKSATETIRKYMKVDPGTTLFDLPDAIKEFLSRLERRQTHLSKSVKSSVSKDDLHGDLNYE